MKISEMIDYIDNAFIDINVAPSQFWDQLPERYKTPDYTERMYDKLKHGTIDYAINFLNWDNTKEGYDFWRSRGTLYKLHRDTRNSGLVCGKIYVEFKSGLSVRLICVAENYYVVDMIDGEFGDNPNLHYFPEEIGMDKYRNPRLITDNHKLILLNY